MKNKDLLISIIVPVYNVELYLSKCIESIINQTYKNIEIILINDGSTDSSGQICDNYAKKDSRIRVFHKENEGVSIARNTGLSYAKGEYIGFIDADDYIHSDMYKLLLEEMQEKGADIVTCSYCFDYNGKFVHVENKKAIPETMVRTSEFIRYAYERDAYKGIANFIVTKLYKRKLIFGENGELLISFKENYKLGEDNIFNAEIYCKNGNIFYLDKPLYYYVQHENSVMHNKLVQLNTLSLLKAYEHVIEMFENHNIEEDSIDLVKRFYVYWCGRHLEQAIEIENEELVEKLKKMTKKELLSYVKTNMDSLERVEWIIKLLLYEL